MNANEATLNGTTVVEREWPSFGGNPKEHVLLRRRKAAFAHGTHDRGKIIIQQNKRRSFAGHVGPFVAHSYANMCGF